MVTVVMYVMETIYLSYVQPLAISDDYDEEIDKYATLIASANYKDPFLFWKKYEYLFSTLAPLAKKFLGVPASSASVERMFNISGHIFSNKSRRTGVTLFENLVFKKLNESYL